MGVVIEGLWDHEGYAARRLPDGTLAGTWTWATREFTAFAAACDCGWRGTVGYPPTDLGEEMALDHWQLEHASPLLDQLAERHRAELAQGLRALGGIANFVDNPANLSRISRAAERVRELAEAVQRDLDRQTPQREAEHER
jgi:hypothetical protein